MKVELQNSSDDKLPIEVINIKNDTNNAAITLNPEDMAQVTIYENNYCLTDGENYYYYFLPNETSPISKIKASQKTAGRCDNPQYSPYVSVDPFELRTELN
jgi:hypothetical protein